MKRTLFSANLIFSFFFFALCGSIKLKAQLAQVQYISLKTNADIASAPLTTLAVGSTVGSADVSSGAATYTIPINVPPGTNGVAPSLSISYNSMGGNGVMGLGWSLSGTSMISRSTKSIYHNGKVEGVQLNNLDPFVLDGSRIIPTTGNNGEQGTIYKTENESFSIIRSYNEANIDGPGYFDVVAKDGIIMEYGNTADSRFVYNSTILFWKLNKIKYPDGNYMTFQYGGTSDRPLLEIKYTGNTNVNLEPFNKIIFEYETRFDISTIYEAGAAVVNDKLLAKIKLFADSETDITRSYEFRYGKDEITSYLVEVNETGSYTPSPSVTIPYLNPTIFKYGDIEGFNTSGTALSFNGDATKEYQYGDFDGDGYSDIILANYHLSNGIKIIDDFVIQKNSPAGYSVSIPQGVGSNYSFENNKNKTPSVYFSSDFNGDGADDLLFSEIDLITKSVTKINIRISNASSDFGNLNFTANQIALKYNTPALNKISWTGRFLFNGDFNGDRIQDILLILGTGSREPQIYLGGISSNFSTISVNRGAGTFFGWGAWVEQYPEPTLNENSDTKVIDFDGDGKSEIWIYNNGGIEIITFDNFTSNSVTTKQLYLSESVVGLIRYFGDFNGDKKTDILNRTSVSDWKIAYSTGNSFEILDFEFGRLPRLFGASGTYDMDKLEIADINGDGKVDIFHGWNTPKTENSNENRAVFDVYYSKGNSFYKVQNFVDDDIITVEGNSTSIIPNYNGDGKASILNFNTIDDDFKNYTFGYGANQSLLQRAKNGVGLKSEFFYRNLSFGSSGNTVFYSRSSISKNVMRNIQPSVFAVQHLYSDNGSGGQFESQFSYEDLKFHREGKGLLGFAKITVVNPINNTKVITENNFDGSFFIALPSKSESFLLSDPTPKTNSVSFTEITDLGSKRFLAKSTKSLNINYLEGGKVNSSQNTINNDGNLTKTISQNTINLFSNGNFNGSGTLFNSTSTTILPSWNSSSSGGTSGELNILNGNLVSIDQNNGSVVLSQLINIKNAINNLSFDFSWAENNSNESGTTFYLKYNNIIYVQIYTTSGGSGPALVSYINGAQAANGSPNEILPIAPNMFSLNHIDVEMPAGLPENAQFSINYIGAVNSDNIKFDNLVWLKKTDDTETITTDYTYGTFPTTAPYPNKPLTIIVTKQRGTQTSYAAKTTFDYYEATGQLRSKTDFSDKTKNLKTEYIYDTKGNLTNTIVTPSDPGSEARTTETIYDSKGRAPIRTVNELIQTEGNNAEIDYRFGKPKKTYSISGIETTFEYDAFGRNTETIQRSNFNNDKYTVGQTYNWDAQTFSWGNISNTSVYRIDTSHPGKPDVKTWYDILGREIKTETEGFSGVANNLITYNYYDNKGNLSKSTNPHKSNETPIVTSNIYDDYNRLTSSSSSVAAFGSSSMSYTYEGTNLKVITTSPDSKISTKITDATGKLIQAIDNNGSSLYYFYNSQGNLTIVSNAATVTAASKISESEYDPDYAYQTKLIDKNAGSTSYEYNSLNLLIKETDNKGQIHTMQYDKLNRIITRNEPTGQGSTTYTYYPAGNGGATNQLQSVSSFAGNTESYTYDDFGRMLTSVESIDGKTFTTSFNEYDKFDNLKEKTYPSGFIIKYNYEADTGYPTTITKDNGNAIYTNTGINSFGQNTNYILGNGKSSTNNYVNGIAQSYITSGVQDYVMDWNLLNGNLKERIDNRKGRTETFGYDNLNRLTTATLDNNTTSPLTLTYANYGNISTKSDVGYGNYQYNATKVNAVYQVNSYVIPVLQQDIVYNSFEQPLSITEKTSTTQTKNNYLLLYTYGSDYNRIKSILTKETQIDNTPTSLTTIETINTRYYFGDYEQNINSGGTKDIHYISSPAGLIAIVERVNGSDTYHYTYTDHLGSIVTVTNESGGVEYDLHFDAWGRRCDPTTWAPQLPTASTGLPDWLYRGYTGHEHLDQFGLINMNARLYDPVLGRVLSPDNYVADAASTQDYNRYTYANNNPMKYVDPDGNFAHLIFGAVIGGFTNWIAHGGQFSWKGLGYFGIGATAGALGAGIGAGVNVAMANGSFGAGFMGTATGITSSGFVGGLATGTATGFTNGFISNTGNSLLSGKSFGNSLGNGLKYGFNQGIIGGIFGGISGGIDANSKNLNFWNGTAELDLSNGYGAHGVIPEYPIIGKYVGKFEGVNVYESKGLGDFGEELLSGGITLPGRGITVGRGVFSRNGNYDLMKHEFGHILQSRQLGKLQFYYEVGLESLKSASLHQKGFHSHDTFWTEVWANRLAKDYFTRTSWNSLDYPVNYLGNDIFKVLRLFRK